MHWQTNPRAGYSSIVSPVRVRLRTQTLRARTRQLWQAIKMPHEVAQKMNEKFGSIHSTLGANATDNAHHPQNRPNSFIALRLSMC